MRVLYDVIDSATLVTDSMTGMLQLNRRARCGACGQPKEGRLAWRRVRHDRFPPFLNGPFDRRGAIRFLKEQAGRLRRRGGTLVVQVVQVVKHDGPEPLEQYAMSLQHVPEALHEFCNSRELKGMPNRLLV